MQVFCDDLQRAVEFRPRPVAEPLTAPIDGVLDACVNAAGGIHSGVCERDPGAIALALTGMIAECNQMLLLQCGQRAGNCALVFLTQGGQLRRSQTLRVLLQIKQTHHVDAFESERLHLKGFDFLNAAVYLCD